MSSLYNELSFKSSVNAICVWWVVSVGLSVILYVLHSLITHGLKEYKKYTTTSTKKTKIVDKTQLVEDYSMNFDDIISGIKGMWYLKVKINKKTVYERKKRSLLFGMQSCTQK